MKTLSTLMLLAGALPCIVACNDSGESPDPPDQTARIVPYLAVTSQSTVDALDGSALTLWGDYLIEMIDESDTARARLRWDGYSRQTEGVQFDLTAWQDLTAAPLGERYLTESDFTSFDVTLTLDGRHYSGAVQRVALHLDVLMHVHHGEITLRFVPATGDGEAIDLTIELAGYIDGVGCSATPDGYGEARLDIRRPSHLDDPPACVEVFDRVRDTPDDPDAPPPPYDLYADDVIEDGDSEPIPVAPPPD